MTIPHEDGPVSELQSRFQEVTLVIEGAALADNVIPEDLHNALVPWTNNYAAKTPVDYYPHSKSILKDHLHPAMYAYVMDES